MSEDLNNITDDSVDSKCEVCHDSATQKCGACHTVFYCSKEHQKAHWKIHKKNCKPFQVCNDEVLGRHLVATKDLKPGEIVLQEPPLIWGPAQLTVPVCLGCGQSITEKNSKPCTKCGWPMCSDICEKSPAHLPECRYTVLRGEKISIKNFGVVHPTYQCITVLRCLYQKQFLPEVWEKLDKLQSHCEERRNTKRYENDRTYIAKFILRFFKLSSTFTEQDILRICGIVMVNAHEVPLTTPPHIAIYNSTSMFEHNCKANCSKTFTNQGAVLVKSGVPIKKGEHLNICYTEPIWGTTARRYHLYNSKFFWCTCQRCADPTEFGTYFNALKCQSSDNCKGYLLPKSFIENEGNLQDWICNKCNETLSSYCVQDLLESVGQDLAKMEKGVSKACKEFIEICDKYLHPNHFHLTDVKFALAQIIGEEFAGGLPAVSDDDLELKARICQSLLKLTGTLCPAESRLRGLLLFDLHIAIAEIGRRSPDPKQLHATLLESRPLLQEAATLLKHEPDAVPESKIHKLAVENLRGIDRVLLTLHKALGDSP